MTVRQRGSHWYYDFKIKGKRYREVISGATTKRAALEAETVERKKVYDGTYRAPQLGNQRFSEFVEQTYLPWAKQTNARGARTKGFRTC